MKRIFLILILMLGMYTSVYADEYENMIEEYAKSYAQEIETELDENGFSYSENLIPDFSVKSIIDKALNGEIDLSFEKFKEILSDTLIPEIKTVSKSVLYLICLTLSGAFLLNLQNSELGNTVSKTGNMFIYLISAGVIANIFSCIAGIAYDTVNTLSIFLKSIIPVVLMSLYGAGCIVSTTALRPVLAAIVEICVHIIKNFLFPAAMLSFAISIADCLSEKIKADKFAQLMTKTVKWLLACMLTVFTGIVGLKSIAAASIDGLTVKLTKLATSNLIPVVGGLLSESVETVMNCSIIIKNSVGICGILAVIYICLIPLLKIGINIIFLRFTAAVIQPVSDERIVKCISSAADLLSLIFAIVASVAVMFILVITIVINTGNSAVMLGK